MRGLRALTLSPTVFGLLLAGLVLSGCCSDPTTRAPLAPTGYQQQAVCAPPQTTCAPAQTAPFAAGPMIVQNQGVYQMGAPVAVESAVGFNEHARAVIAVPPNVAACITDGAAKGMVVIGDTLRCVANNLWPAPQPTQRLIYAAPPQVQYYAVPVQSAPCAPPLPQSVPVPRANPCQPPEPISLVPAGR